MTAVGKIALEALNAMDRAAFVAALGGVYEHAPWVADAAFSAKPFSTVQALFSAMRGAVQGIDDDKHLGLVRAHPDLAGKVARAGALTPASQSEQIDTGLDRLSPAELVRFEQLNEAY